ncbi:MAG: hypothetical protein MJZ52_01830 [Bacteroidales bacterium]|nr:hypothetical protein [Bacteroidales bacterium]
MNFEEKIHQDLHSFLLMEGEVDERLPESPDINDKWPSVAESYLPDGLREFRDYPAVSLGWMMYVGMAVAQCWDEDWQIYGNMPDLYAYLRDKEGFDLMDEYIRRTVLRLKTPAYDETEQLVQQCAERTLSALRREPLEPGTKEAFDAYVACLRQLYQMGAAVQLHRLNYRMENLRLC